MFQKNEQVKWASQAGGHTKIKMGAVIAVLPPGTNVVDYLRANNLPMIRKPGKPRQTFSYLVQVGKKIYWPKVNGLTTHVPATTSELTPA